MGKITTQFDFLYACAKYPPNNFIKSWYSTFWNTETNINKYSTALGFIFIIGNILGFITQNLWFVLPPNIILAIVVIYGFIAVTWNNIRIKNIRKYLGISIKEYERCSELYLNGDGTPKNYK